MSISRLLVPYCVNGTPQINLFWLNFKFKVKCPFLPLKAYNLYNHINLED